MERTNIRYVTPEDLGEPLDLSVVDVSFISLKIVLPAIQKLLKPTGQVLCLIKPQFEAGREKVGKKGVVRDPKVHLEVLEQVRTFTDIPFVLHGCTGMNEEMIQKSKQYGVAKINFGTQVRHNYMCYLREGCAMDFQDHCWKLSQFAEKKLREDIKQMIRLAGSEGKA